MHYCFVWRKTEDIESFFVENIYFFINIILRYTFFQLNLEVKFSIYYMMITIWVEGHVNVSFSNQMLMRCDDEMNTQQKIIWTIC